MTRINLLPWRETERKRRQRDFGMTLVGMLVFGVLIGILVHWQIENLISYQERRNHFLEGEIAQLDRKIRDIRDLEKTKAGILARMRIIQQLQESRPEIVHLFDELVNTLPDGVYLTSIKQKERTLLLEGRAQSNARVSAYMRNIEASRWLGKPRLLVIENKQVTGTGLSHFKLEAKQIRPHPADPG